ncbi:aKG-HExxH-type peptide beta-hydroxylase [Spirilliplanes yamanashiensis]|uniref:HEXXH motif domain-containing protein n=1 Tax=Spirilliplanes yamanashiensis TaxID=42233 RepID=A0A8J3YDG1_9ACTN|nr:HEXXH motif-containing putative peptide modification protein [Spirilliplanes yamanashiensis]MDP9816185.1 hypothetical protein [Spirilliplanes yamanashiensis]GIJ05710.1 hypothetical protein Sya03_50620 [Spirilliplanes yamanashiensis]
MPSPLALSDAELVALGAGRAGRATVDRLRRAELGRTMLLLREIARAAPRTGARWYAELADAERRAPGRVRAALAYPLTGAWAAHHLAALRTGDAAAELPDLLADRPVRRLTAARDGLTLDLALDDAAPARGLLGLPPAGPLGDGDAERWQKLLAEAWPLLVDGHRPWARLVADVLVCVVPVRPDAGARGISATSAHAFGGVALSEPADAAAFAAGLLHETQHSVLNAVLHLIDLVEPGGERGYSPWRDDPRPATGVLHGAYAYLAVTDFWRAGPGPAAAFEFARRRSAVAAAAAGLRADGRLTAAGERFTAALAARVAPWLDVPVDPVAGRLAAGANADHRACWRLRNLAVDPAAARALAAAFAAGDPPGPAPVALRPASGRALERNPRLDAAHAYLAGGPPPPGPDGAWLRGDVAAARAGYVARLRADPGDDHAWAGLSLVTPGLDRPEAAAAVCRAAGPDADPPAVAAWLTAPA